MTRTTIQRQQLEKERVFDFLTGLNNDLNEVRDRLVGRTPFPDTEVRCEEACRRVMLITPELQPTESSAHHHHMGNPLMTLDLIVRVINHGVITANIMVILDQVVG